jgi:methionyl-tRNA formyltransferase
MLSYAICTVKAWNADAFRRRTPTLPGKWYLIEKREDLTLEFLHKVSPRYLFFPHWSWRVPKVIFSRYECICFHMTDVPYGRGGSPLQNLIIRGHATTMFSALRMVETLDAGPVYLKRPLSLAGRAEEIFERGADVVYDMIAEIVAREPKPVAQTGEPVVFSRRTPEQSRLPDNLPGAALYDFIRMLDAPTYPKAFIDYGSLRLEFGYVRLLASGEVEASVTIRPQANEPAQ